MFDARAFAYVHLLFCLVHIRWLLRVGSLWHRTLLTQLAASTLSRRLLLL
jgi:hypothetical protein